MNGVVGVPRPRCRAPSGSAVLLYLGARVGLGLAFAWPTATAVGALLASEPDGDALLWEPRAEMLVDVAARLEPAARGLVGRGGTALLFGLFVMLLPLAVLLRSMVRGRAAESGASRDGFGPALRAAGDAGPLALLQGLTLLVQVALVGLVVFVGVLAARSLELGREGQLVAQAVALAVGALAVWLTGLWQDLGRVAVVQHGEGFVGAVGMSLAVSGAGLARPIAAAAWRAGIGAALALAGMWAGLRYGGARAGLGISVAIHLAVLVAMVALRISWLRWLGTHVLRWTVSGER